MTSHCLEIKHTYFGEKVEAPCKLLALNSEYGILRYDFDKTWTVNGIVLQPPMYTLAYYAENLPYNVYCWYDDAHGVVGYYFNIVDRTSLSKDVFVYRDLIVDILLDTKLDITILDEDEIPDDMPPELLKYIAATKDQITANLEKIVNEIQTIISPFVGDK